MITRLISRIVLIIFGALYPAYASFKTIKNKDARAYVKWMMYWIVFACFLAVESLADAFFFWLPLYDECKVLVVVWLMSPWTRGASILYRKCLHPYLLEHEADIDQLLDEAHAQGIGLVREWGARGLDVCNRAVLSAIDSGLRRTLSLSELIRRENAQPIPSAADSNNNGGAAASTRRTASADASSNSNLRRRRRVKRSGVVKEEERSDEEEIVCLN